MKPLKRPKRISAARKHSVWLVVGVGIVGATALVLTLRPTRVESTAPAKAEVQITAEDDLVLIPAPTRNIARGEKLSAVEFTRLKWPKERVSANYISDLSQYADAIAATPIPQLLPVPISSVTREALDENAVVDGIPAGMRAITVKVDAESAVEGWAASGNYVDVILIRATKENELGLQAKVIAENVRILSAGRSARPINASEAAPEAPSTATLLVSQEDALAIKAAMNLGKLTFALRAQGDVSPAAVTSLNQRKILGAPTVQVKKDNEFQGSARGPDGRTYLLEKSNRWIRTTEEGAGAKGDSGRNIVKQEG